MITTVINKVRMLGSISVSYPRNTLNWEVVVLTFYGVLILMGAMQHELWRDEAQSWLIARDLSPLQIFLQINYEGTPALWHLILMPFAKLGFPPSTITYLHALIAFGAATLFIINAPFSKCTKLTFVFSFYMAWEYAIIARNYNLTVLLLFAIAANYKNRFTKPLIHASLILLLFNTNVHSFFISLGLSSLYFYETYNKKIPLKTIKFPMVIMGFGLLISVLQLIPAEDNMRGSLLYEFNYLALPRASMNALFPVPVTTNASLLIYSFFSMLSLFSLAILGYAYLYLYQHSRVIFYLNMVAVSWLFYLFVFKHFGGYRHHGLILIFLMFSLWVSYYYKSTNKTKIASEKLFSRKKAMQLLNISFVFSMFSSAYMHFNEQTLKYSGAKEMASFLSSSGLSDKTIIGYPSTVTSSLAPYLPQQRIWYPDIEDFGTYIIWSDLYNQNKEISLTEAVKRIKNNNLHDKKSYLLLNDRLPAEMQDPYKLVYKVDRDIFGPSNEQYYLYQIKQ